MSSAHGYPVKAFGGLGFIKIWAKEFSDLYETKTLYTSLVRPAIAYDSVICNPHCGIFIDKIEPVQKQFVLFSLRNLFYL